MDQVQFKITLEDQNLEKLSPYTSLSEEAPGVGKTYGDQVIELDIGRLETDINNGVVKDVEILSPSQVQSELQGKVDLTQNRYDQNPSRKNLDRLESSQRDLTNATRDQEVLIKKVKYLQNILKFTLIINF